MVARAGAIWALLPQILRSYEIPTSSHAAQSEMRSELFLITMKLEVDDAWVAGGGRHRRPARRRNASALGALGKMVARSSPSSSPARRSPGGSKTKTSLRVGARVLLHSHSWSHCDGVAIRYKAHARQLRSEGYWVGLSLSAAESEELSDRLPAWLAPAGSGEPCLLSLPDAARVPCSDGPMMPMGSLRNLLRALVSVVRLQPDVIHATFDSHAVSWLLIARLAGVPL